MKSTFFYSVVIVFSLLVSCAKESTPTITVKNTLNVPRNFETVEINRADIQLKGDQSFESLSVVDLSTKKVLVSQFVDTDQDGTADVLLFQPKLEANAEKQFQLAEVEAASQPKVVEHCFSRFVPERTDDYAWENNKVAFRTYGPTAQKMVEESVPGGTLSSGIDAWLKRVDYPIINKWYKNELEKQGSYHIDHGEGLDNFHVGISRGVGGTAVKKDTSYYVSKNFIDWKTITTGPIRTSFVLKYEDWDANGTKISETKHISLDYGSNLSKFEIEVGGTETIHVGLTLHEKDGEPTQNKDKGFISYWEPHADSELGTAIVVPNRNLISSELYDSNKPDWSNLYAQVKVNDGKAVYYAGFGWKKAKEFTSKADWNNYLDAFAQKINNPLEVTIK